MSSALPPRRRTPVSAIVAYGHLVFATGVLAAMPAFALVEALRGPVDHPTIRTEAAVPPEVENAVASHPAQGGVAALGKDVFERSCVACHQGDGRGIPGAFPPLANSDYLLEDTDRAIGVVLHGLVGPITVNGVAFESAMPPQPLSDEEAAAVLTYVMTSWGNTGPAVSVAEVARVRLKGP